MKRTGALLEPGSFLCWYNNPIIRLFDLAAARLGRRPAVFLVLLIVIILFPLFVLVVFFPLFQVFLFEVFFPLFLILNLFLFFFFYLSDFLFFELAESETT